jgi:hypothetical protein
MKGPWSLKLGFIRGEEGKVGWVIHESSGSGRREFKNGGDRDCGSFISRDLSGR